MDFHLGDEHRMMVDTVRDFSAKELAPQAAEIDRTGRFPMESIRKLARLGLVGMTVPAGDGGSQAGALALALILAEIAAGDSSVAVTLGVSNMLAEVIAVHGTPDQKRRFIPLVCQGERPIGAFALTESHAGSDAANLKTRAGRKGDDYILNGTKTFITSAAHASLFLVMARTGEAPGAAGVSAFLIERGTPGLVAGKEEKKMGLRGSSTADLLLEDCRIPVTNRIGAEGQGFKVAMTALDGGRIGVAAQAVGIGRAALAAARDYSKERVAFGKPISAFQAIQWKLADMATSLDAAALLTWRAAWLKETGRPFAQAASMAKLFASEAANRVCREAVQIFGGYGYCRDYPVERLMRDVKAATIYEGTSEVQRMLIARRLLA